MKRLSLNEVIKGLKEMDYEVENLGRDEIYRYVVLTADHETKYFENGRKLVSYAKGIIDEVEIEKSEQDKIMENLISSYYTSSSWEEKGDLFFTIDEYLKKNRSSLNSDMIRRASNVIVMG